MTPLESQIIKKIISSYMTQGVNPRKILDNPIFIQLPLEAKVHALKEYASILATSPGASPISILEKIGRSGLAAGLSTAGLVGISQFHKLLTTGASPSQFNPRNVVIGAGVGFGLGAIKQLVVNALEKQEDRKFQNMLQTNSPEDTLGLGYSLPAQKEYRYPVFDQLSVMNNTIHGQISRKDDDEIITSPSISDAVKNLISR